MHVRCEREIAAATYWSRSVSVMHISYRKDVVSKAPQISPAVPRGAAITSTMRAATCSARLADCPSTPCTTVAPCTPHSPVTSPYLAGVALSAALGHAAPSAWWRRPACRCWGLTAPVHLSLATPNTTNYPHCQRQEDTVF